MPIHRQVEPITEDDAVIEQALLDAHLPSLIPALAQLTGDLSLLRPELRPSTDFFAGEQGGLTPELQQEARALAQGVLRRYRDGGSRAATTPSEAVLKQIAEFMAGQDVAAYLPLLLEELAVTGQDRRAPGWSKTDIAPGTPFLVAIIGAGMSGILAAVRLSQAGIPFVILEKNAEVGGTWYENTYPGCRVDIANHFYSYSFAQKEDWPNRYSPQRVLLDYFRDCADEFGVRPHLRLQTEVISAAFDEQRSVWRIQLRSPEGEETLEANALISAVGQLNQPKLPDIRGMECFGGPSFHSARWDHRVSVAGKRVAVIGNGASAAQFVPEIAEDAALVRIFQRTPNWMIPVPEYHAEVPAGLRWLCSHVPNYAHWYRFWIFWVTADGSILPRVRVDPSWPHPERAVSASNDELRTILTEAMKLQLADRPDLLAKVLPSYPPASKRILVDNGIYFQTLKRPNVQLETTGIREINERGVVTQDGVTYAADVIVYATGFQASKFLTPMKLTGRGGADLHAQWDGNARAYLGITVPNFPNFFCCYGPNTNIVVNGSIIYFSECEVRYILGCLELLLREKKRSLAPRRDVHDAYNQKVDAGNLQMAWGVSKVPSWYKSASGRVAQNWPFTLLEYWQQTLAPNPADYEVA